MLFTEGDLGTEMFGVVDREASNSATARTWSKRSAQVKRSAKWPSSIARPAASPPSRTERSEVATINERTFLFLVHETPTFALQVMRSLTERVRTLGFRV